MSRYKLHPVSEQHKKELEIIAEAITHAQIHGKTCYQTPITDEQAMQLQHFAKQGVKVRLK